MSQAPRTTSTDELPKELLDLQSAVSVLPSEVQEQLLPLFLKVIDGTRRRRRILNLVQEALGQLRLDLKYLMFDLEATRRERDEYRRQLDEQQRNSGGA